MVLFQYLYRDGGNNKAFGEVTLDGELCDGAAAVIRAALLDGEWFIPEQVGLPPLQPQLAKWSGGRTELDHDLHEFVGLRRATDARDMRPETSIDELAAKFAQIGGRWDFGASVWS
jgi:hypothetical protein